MVIFLWVGISCVFWICYHVYASCLVQLTLHPHTCMSRADLRVQVKAENLLSWTRESTGSEVASPRQIRSSTIICILLLLQQKSIMRLAGSEYVKWFWASPDILTGEPWIPRRTFWDFLSPDKMSGENLPLRRTFEILSGETGGFNVLWAGLVYLTLHPHTCRSRADLRVQVKAEKLLSWTRESTGPEVASPWQIRSSTIICILCLFHRWVWKSGFQVHDLIVYILNNGSHRWK